MQHLRFAHAPETVRLGDVEVRRIGFDARQLSSEDRAAAHAVLLRAVELGVQLFATDGPFSDALVRETLSPYPGDLAIIATAGGCRSRQGTMVALTPDDLRATAERHLTALGLEQLQVLQLWWTEQPDVAFDEALDAMIELVQAGKVRQLALGNVTLAQLRAALAKTAIVAVEAPLDGALLEACERHGILYTPIVDPAPPSSAVELAARRAQCTPAQLVIASVLARSPALVPVVGSSKVVTVEEQIGAVKVALDESTLGVLAA